jgi:hypothetical protein
VDETIIATGVELRRIEDPGDWLETVTEHEGRLAARRLAARLEAGEAILAEAQSFIEFIAAGEVHRISGPTFAREIELEGDLTSRFIEFADEGRELAYSEVAEVRIHGFHATRWQAYAAPSRVELDSALSELLDSVRS